MEVYSNGLDGFCLEDIRAAVATLALQERAEGKTAMPSLGEMVTACQAASKRRHENAQRDKMRNEDEYRKAHPEEFCTFKEVLNDMHAMRARCEETFGPDWRADYSGMDLTEVYQEAIAFSGETE